MEVQSGNVIPERFAKLNSNWLLRGWTDMPLAVVNCATGFVRQLNEKEFYVAESCDGIRDFNSLAFLPEHNALLNQLIKQGIAETCQKNDFIEPMQQYRMANTSCIKGIQWCVTGRCNLKCQHCYMESPSGKYGELPFDYIVQLIDQFEQANLPQISLTGGEPFFRNDLLEIIALLAERKICVRTIFSNGLLITDDHLKSIKEIGFSPNFQISFDGIGAHDYMRGVKGIEQDVIHSILKLQDAGFFVRIATSIDRLNISHLADTYKLIKDLGLKSWHIMTPQKSGNWRGTSTGLSLIEAANALMPLLNFWLADGRPFDIQLAGFYHGIPKTKAEKLDSSTKNLFDYTADSYDCGACREQPNLMPDGTLLPCPGYAGSVVQDQMPNLFKCNLAEVWANSSSLRKIIDMKKIVLLNRNPECDTCELFKDCGIGCRVVALNETGNIFAKDPVACDLWKNGYKKLFLDIENGDEFI